MFVVDNKFDIGDEVYLIKQVPIKYNCPVCQGEGDILYNNYILKCPKCRGSKKIVDDKVKAWEVMEDIYKINSIKVNCGNNLTVRYKVSGFNRAEENIFKTFKDAEIKCYELNTGKKQSCESIIKECSNCINQSIELTKKCYECKEGIENHFIPRKEDYIE